MRYKIEYAEPARLQSTLQALSDAGWSLFSCIATNWMMVHGEGQMVTKYMLALTAPDLPEPVKPAPKPKAVKS